MKKPYILSWSLFFVIVFSSHLRAQTNNEELAKRIQELEKDVLDLQISSMLNKVMISGEFFNTISKVDTYNNPYGKKKRHQENFVGNLILNVNSAIGSDVQIYTSFYSSFFYGSSVFNPDYSTGQITDSTVGYGLNVIKAYIDYKIWQEQIIFSLGRMPTVYGPPSHLYDLTKRTGTYPLIGFSIPFDGGAITWNLKQTFSLKDDLDSRFIFAVANRGNATDLDSGRGAAYGTSRIAENTYIYSYMLDYGTKRMPNISSEGRFILQGYYGKLKTFPALRVRGLLDSELPGDHDLYEVYASQDDLLDMYGLIMHLEMSDVFKLPVDSYITYKRNWISSHADVLYRIVDNGEGGGNLGDTGNLGGYFVNGKEAGDSILMGGQFKFSSKISIGGEYLFASEGSMDSTYYTKTSTKFYNIIGDGYHLYYTQSLKADRMNYRFGYMNALSKKELTGFSQSNNNKRAITYYAHLGLRF